MLRKYRLYHILRNSGLIYTRSECLELLKNKKVSVNKKLVSSPDYFVRADDIIIVNNKRVTITMPKKVYILLNKPAGYTCHRISDSARESVMSLVDLPVDIKRTIFPVGRLDVSSSGLIILTNDGRFAAELLHNGIEKEYECLVSGYLHDEIISKLEKGVNILLEADKRNKMDDRVYVTKPCCISIVDRSNLNSKIKVKLCEGRKRQLRKMFIHVGFPLVSLRRIRVGSYLLDELEEGKWKFFYPKK